MALTGMLLQRDGWESQAANLSLTHGAVGTAAVAVAEQMTRRRAPQRPMSRSEQLAAEIESRPETAPLDYANNLEAMRAKVIELQEQVARKTAAARIIDAHLKTLAAQAATAQQRVGELEIELSSTQEALARQENENCSLQSSLDLMVSENARLSRRLLEECAACDTVTSRLERVNSTLTATDVERDNLIAAVAEADKKHQFETEDLQSRLRTTTARVVAAETQLAELQQTLAVRTEEKNAAEGKAVSATLARNLALNELKTLQAAVQTKEREVLELQQSRSKLVVGLNTLLQNFKSREAALAAAKERIQALSGRLAVAEADLRERQAKIEQLQILPESDFASGHSNMKRQSKACPSASMTATAAERGYARAASAKEDAPRPAAQLLADTVTF